MDAEKKQLLRELFESMSKLEHAIQNYESLSLVDELGAADQAQWDAAVAHWWALAEEAEGFREAYPGTPEADWISNKIESFAMAGNDFGSIVI